MPARLADADQMTVEEFLAFTAARPEGERWELIEGVAVMNPSPTEWHQRIVLNIAAALDDAKMRTGASWVPLLGVGTRVPVSPNSLPQPDLFIKAGAANDSSISDDALVIFEVLSRSNTRLDRAWRRRVYASVPNCQYYVTVSTKTAAVVRHDRSDGWQEKTAAGLDAALQLPAIEVTIPLVEIYRWTPLE
jgi:Uma2 family endonuclease